MMLLYWRETHIPYTTEVCMVTDQGECVHINVLKDLSLESWTSIAVHDEQKRNNPWTHIPYHSGVHGHSLTGQGEGVHINAYMLKDVSLDLNCCPWWSEEKHPIPHTTVVCMVTGQGEGVHTLAWYPPLAPTHAESETSEEWGARLAAIQHRLEQGLI